MDGLGRVVFLTGRLGLAAGGSTGPSDCRI